MPEPIRRILVANRGEIAGRVIRTARTLGIQTVAVHSDADAAAPYVSEADRIVRLPGVSSTETYLDPRLLVAAALASGADAVHPGYGFLSENPSFARAVRDAGLTWIGPAPETIEAMALKVEAKRLAAGAGVPLVPGAELPSSLSDDEVVAACAAVGYPLLVKASAGGGGKGMRLVVSPEVLLGECESARREAASAFGDATVFVERYLAGARHVEVQVFGDRSGSVVHLFERECSIQRRHQKVIEEAPSPGVTDAVRGQLHEAAVSLARAISYEGAGTVEFMVFGESTEQEFYFLEMNTRLQVEHPVTEAITGIDLVTWQIAVAQGDPLPLAQEEIRAVGHAIEARLYAEDPAHDYRPGIGTIHRFAVAPEPSVRVDAGVADGSVVTSHYDPMLAKVIAHRSSRSAAAMTLADGLERMTLHGPPTNRASLAAIVRSPAFLAGDTTTSFLDDHPEVLAPAGSPEDEQRHAIAVAVTACSPSESLVPAGWRNVPGVPESVTMIRRGETGATTVLLDRGRGDLAVRIVRTAEVPYAGVYSLEAERLDGVDVVAHGHRLDAGVDVDVAVGTVAARCTVTRYGDEVFVDDGIHSSAWTLATRFPDRSRESVGHGAITPVPGTITAVLVAAGDRVEEGQVLVILEAMKMEHRVRADAEAVVARVLVEVGQSVDSHALVVELADEEPVS